MRLFHFRYACGLCELYVMSKALLWGRTLHFQTCVSVCVWLCTQSGHNGSKKLFIFLIMIFLQGFQKFLKHILGDFAAGAFELCEAC